MEWFGWDSLSIGHCAGGRSRAPSDLLKVKVAERLKGGESLGENIHAVGAQTVAPDMCGTARQ